jgi:nucleoside-diphosphate-sugar epimerase
VNTYTFTKMLTELAIAEFNNEAFPVAIVRPSIVVRSMPRNCHISTWLKCIPSTMRELYRNTIRYVEQHT